MPARKKNRSRRRRDALLGPVGEGRRPELTDEAFRSVIPVLRPVDEAPKEILTVKSVDLLKKENRTAHRTQEYEKSDLIIRRGQPFDLSVTFHRDIVDTDVITLQLATGARPIESKGSLIRLPLVRTSDKPNTVASLWEVTSLGSRSSTINLRVRSSAHAIIGGYDIFVETKSAGKTTVRRWMLENEEIILLFNPWCKEDDVYVEDETWQEEYVLNERGRIWVGSSTSFNGRPWYFGQFDYPCLDAALILLDRAELGESARRSPIAVTRAISSQANSNDDNGVLSGRWSDTYPKGTTPPCEWNGSVDILQQFLDKGEPVCYGQCWVFSGITTTLLRTLGLAARSVTNFESAHDCDCSMTIDNHWDAETGEPLTDLNDSVWNFHVWNEAYFRRPDLPSGYDGWQAVDATPQEVSEGVMRCGPAAVKAVKEGHVYLGYDTGFIFSEVNGDRVHWAVEKDGSMCVVRLMTGAVGRHISTKAIGSSDRQDITDLYKYPEGSEDERRVVQFVNRFSTRKNEDIYNCNKVKEMVIALKAPDNVTIGDDFELKISIKNIGRVQRTVRGRLSAKEGFYTGVSGRQLASQTYEVKVDPGKEVEVKLSVKEGDYLGKLSAEALVAVYASFRVKDTKEIFVAQDAVFMIKPRLTIQIPEMMAVGEVREGRASFKNPLNLSLTNAVFHVEGPGIVGNKIFKVRKAVMTDEEVSITFKISPRNPGHREIYVTFSSDQLSGVDDTATLLVT